MALPPLFTGATHETDTIVEAPGVAATPVGASGTVLGIATVPDA